MKNFVLILIILFPLIGNTQNRFPAPINGKWGYINKQGELKIPAIFEQEAEFHNGFALIVQENSKILVIDTLGSVIFEFANPNTNRHYAHRFSEGLLAVYEHQKGFGFIDTAGKWVIPAKYHKVLDFSDGLAAVWEDPDIHVDEWSGCGTAVTHPKWGFINREDQYVIQPKYWEVTSFLNGFAITNNGKFIDKKGDTLKSDSIVDVTNRYRRVRLDHSLVYRTGRWVPYNHENFEVCHILAELKEKDKYGFLNFKGDWIIPPIYDGAQFFSNGLAGIEIKGKWGYVNCGGEVVIKPQYQFVYFFSEGMGAVQKNGKWGFINAKGELIIPFEYDERRKFKNGLVKVEKQGKVIYRDDRGTIIWAEK